MKDAPPTSQTTAVKSRQSWITNPPTIFTAAAHGDRYWLDRSGPLGFHEAVHGPFRCLSDACVRANEMNRGNPGLGDADAES